ncbi:MAG: adenylate cyclase [Verrucomicrobiota bacterium]|jgi:adenylate cyclase
MHALIAVGAGLVVAGVYRLEQAGRFGWTLTNWEFGFRDTITATGRLNPPDNRLIFLGIDSASVSLSALDLENLFRDIPRESAEYRALSLMASGFPWSREVYGLLCERLFKAGARAVVFDLLLPKPGVGDDALQAVLRQYQSRVVLGSNFVPETIGPGKEAWTLSLPPTSVVPDLAEDHPSIGYANFWPGFNGVVRSAQYKATIGQLQSGLPPTEGGVDAVLSSLAFRAASQFGPVTLSQPFEGHLIRYTGPAGTYTAIPIYQVFVPAYWQGNFAQGEAFRDKLVLVGPAGNWVHDEHITPFGIMPGPEVQLNATNALLHQAFLRELPVWTNDLLIAGGVIAAWLLTVLVRKTWLRLATFALLAAGYLFSIKLGYDYASVVIPAIPPVLAFGLSGLVSFVYDFTHETLEKLRIRRTLEAYVSKEVVREVLDNPQSYLSKLGGQRASVALIMTDLRSFTTMSEEMDSHQLVLQLNEYLSLMVEDIFSRRGSVDKFIGDAILAVWGHVKSEGPARDVTLAIEAALLMEESLKRLNAEWQSRGLQTFEMGCGVNFGEVIFGNIGSSRKMEPTVIGDAVNATSRLEGLTKVYGRPLLVGEAAADLVSDIFKLQFVDRVTMKGKTKPLRVYSVVSRRDDVLDPQMTAYLEAYERAQASYSAGNLKEALLLFESCVQSSPDDALVRLYVQRCNTFLKHPSETGWTGVHVAEDK